MEGFIRVLLGINKENMRNFSFEFIENEEKIE